MRHCLERRLLRLWFEPRGAADATLAALLGPLSALVARVSTARRRRIAAGKADSARHDRPPVVVVGNLVAGGTGKTPLLIALAVALRERGWRPGVLARGYRGAHDGAPRLLDASATAASLGDEPVLIARRTGCPVAVGRDRAAALALLAGSTDCDVVLSDDGLQHEALPRDVELAVFDRRGAGTGRCLPAGPLREPLDSLAAIDAVVLNGREARPPTPHRRVFRFEVRPTGVLALADGRRWEPAEFAAEAAGQAVTAVAGIGMPQRFFESLAALGIGAVPVALGDHATIDPRRLDALPGRWLIMTEKDAVKCLGFDPRVLSRCVALRVDAVADAGLLDWLEERLNGQPPA